MAAAAPVFFLQQIPLQQPLLIFDWRHSILPLVKLGGCACSGRTTALGKLSDEQPQLTEALLCRCRLAKEIRQGAASLSLHEEAAVPELSVGLRLIACHRHCVDGYSVRLILVGVGVWIVVPFLVIASRIH